MTSYRRPPSLSTCSLSTLFLCSALTVTIGQQRKYHRTRLWGRETVSDWDRERSLPRCSTFRIVIVSTSRYVCAYMSYIHTHIPWRDSRLHSSRSSASQNSPCQFHCIVWFGSTQTLSNQHIPTQSPTPFLNCFSILSFARIQFQFLTNPPRKTYTSSPSCIITTLHDDWIPTSLRIVQSSSLMTHQFVNCKQLRLPLHQHCSSTANITFLSFDDQRSLVMSSLIITVPE